MIGRTFSEGFQHLVADFSGRREQRNLHCLCVMCIAEAPARVDHYHSRLTTGRGIQVIDRPRCGSLRPDTGEERDSFAT